MTDDSRRDTRPRPWLSTGFAAGVLLLLMAGFVGWFGQSLPGGTAYRMGPGYVPHLLAWLIGALGLSLCATGFTRFATPLERWSLRPIVLILGAMAAFAFTIERAGLLVASLVAVLLAGLAGARPALRGIVVLAVCLAVFACLLFPLALQLPLKVLP